MRQRSEVFRGWWVVAAASFALFLSTGTIVILSFGVFLNPLIQYFEASRGAVSVAYTLHGLVGAACTPLIGRLIDRVGPRRVILVGTTLFGSTLLGSLLITSTNIAHLYALFVTLGLLTGCTSPPPYGVVVSRWFDRRRGLALGLLAVGLGTGAMVIPALATRLIAAFGWQIAYATLGGATLLLALPVIAVFLKDDPRAHGSWPDGIEPQTEDHAPLAGLTWAEIRRERTFWLLVLAFFLAGMGLFGCIGHMAALLLDRGGTREAATAASSLVGFALLVGRLGVGYLLDRLFAARLAGLVFVGAALGMVLLIAGNVGVAPLAAFLLGAAMGAEVDFIAYMMSRYFGLRALGTANGFGFSSFALGGSLGVLLMGVGFDKTGAYIAPIAALVLAMIVAAVIMARLGPYRYSVTREA